MRKTRFAALLLALLFLVIMAVPASASSPDALGAKVKIVNFAFMPSSVTVHVGDAVGWKNFAPIQHTTTSDTGLWDSGALNPGSIFLVRFPKTGTFTYHCSIHPSMTGTVVVQ